MEKKKIDLSSNPKRHLDLDEETEKFFIVAERLQSMGADIYFSANISLNLYAMRTNGAMMGGVPGPEDEMGFEPEDGCEH